MNIPSTELPFPDAMNLTLALRAAAAGAEVVQRYSGEMHAVETRAKSAASSTASKSYDLVTNADLESEAAIGQVIRASVPNGESHEILGEETHAGDVTAEHLWVVDPLDGTNNFAHQVPHYAVSIAYVRQGIPMAGVIVNPARNEWHITCRGAGSWRLAGFPGTQEHWERCNVSQVSTLSGSLVGVGFYYDRGAMMRSTLKAVEAFFGREIHGIRRFGTAALDLCMVGMGGLDAFFEYELSPWDFAAGWLFVEEAGGVVSTTDGAPLGLKKSSVLATNGVLHEQAREIAQKHKPLA